jgi:SAM-dependent methyltransferase
MAFLGDHQTMRTRILSLFFIIALVSSLAAQTAGTGQQYQPTVGQTGKDVVWVPTPEELVATMLEIAHVTSNDYVIDLGSGDGRIAIAAARRGARALGIEYNPDMVALSRENAKKAGVSDKTVFRQADIFETDFSQATVLTLYLLPDLNMKLRPKILEMKAGTRVVSHAFDMEEWEADQTVNVEFRTAYLWIVPAKVAGTWTLTDIENGLEFTLRQSFQKIGGSLKKNGLEMLLKNAKLEGDRISFAVDESSTMREYSGRVVGNTMTGTVQVASAAPTKWTATHR